MSLKCSIFGHKYTEPDVERERDEQGSEVVITIRELETCERCGHTRIVSENKEVTTLETPPVGDDGDAADQAPGDGGTGDTAAAAADGAARGTGDPGNQATVEDARDAEILDDDDGAPADAPGQGTADTGAAADTGTAGAAAGAGDEEPHPADRVIEEAPGGDAESGSDADPTAEDDGVIIEGAAEDESDRSRQPGEWPHEADEEAEPDWVAETDHSAPAPDEGPEFESAGSAVTVPEGTFHCGACGFTTEVESSSLREGDFCPECQQGTLEHRPGDA